MTAKRECRPVFSAGEYHARLRRTLTEIDRRGLDALIVSDPCNIFYLSGYDAWSFYVPQFLIVTLADQAPTWIGREMDGNGARLTCFMDDDHIRTYPDTLIQNLPQHPSHFLAEHLAEAGLHEGRIGVEFGNYYYGARTHAELTSRLPDAEFVDAELLVNWQRIVKSEAELSLVREAGQIVEKAMATALAMIDEGVRQCDAAAAIYQAQISGTDEFGGTYTTTPPLMPSGPNATAPHLSWTDQPFARDTSTNIEIAGCRHRYHAPLSRTVYIGTPSQRFDTFAKGLAEGLNETLAAIRPGVTCGELHEIWRRTVAPFGIRKESRIGYSTGIGYPPTWGELTASIRPTDETVLKPGMVFHLMPGIWDRDQGLVLTETFIVTETGHETPSHLPREITIKA